MKLGFMLGVALCALAGCSVSAMAEDAASFPSRPITIVVPATPGGGSDLLARIVADPVGKILGKSMIVVNRPGAGGILAFTSVLQTPADGYTVFIAANSAMVALPLMKQDLTFQQSDFVPVAEVASTPAFLVVNAKKTPAKTLAEFVQYLKASPGKYNFGSSGLGTGPHLAAEWFMLQTGAQMTHVPYQSSGESAQALLGNFIDMTIDTPSIVMPLVKSGDLRALATTAPKRVADYPDIPTLSESYPGFEMVTWWGMFVPRNTPKPIVDKLSAAFGTYLNSPDGIEKMKNAGVVATYSSDDDFASLIKKETATWTGIIKTSGIKIQ